MGSFGAGNIWREFGASLRAGPETPGCGDEVVEDKPQGDLESWERAYWES